MNEHFDEIGEEWDEEYDQPRYEKKYETRVYEIRERLKEQGMREEELNEIHTEMMRFYNVRHSNSANAAGSDAELNWLKAEKSLAQKSRFDKPTESLVDYISKKDGKSKKEVRKRARKVIDHHRPAYLGFLDE